MALADNDDHWQRRMSQMLDWLPSNRDISAEMLAVRVNPPNFQAFVEDLMRRATSGNISVVFRVTSPKTGIPIRDLPFDAPIPSQVEDTYGVEHEISRTRDVKMIVKGTGPAA